MRELTKQEIVIFDQLAKTSEDGSLMAKYLKRDDFKLSLVDFLDKIGTNLDTMFKAVNPVSQELYMNNLGIMQLQAFVLTYHQHISKPTKYLNYSYDPLDMFGHKSSKKKQPNFDNGYFCCKWHFVDKGVFVEGEDNVDP